MTETSDARGTSTAQKTTSETVLLRRYMISPKAWDAFLEVWSEIVPLRERHGFEILFGFADRESNIFTWAIRYQGDVEAAAERYYADPERTALERVRDYVTSYEVKNVEQVR